MNTEAALKMTKARARLIISQPFFGSLALQLKLEECEAVPTAATDGVVILYNPAFINGLTADQVCGLVAHEVMHVAMKHHLRRGERDPEQWNVAADYAINLILTEPAHAFTLPPGGLLDSQYAGLSTEAIYNKLPKQPQGQQGQPGNGDGDGDGDGDGTPQPGAGKPGSKPIDPAGSGGVFDHPLIREGKGSANATEIAQAESDLDQKLKQAAQAAKAQGKGSAGIDRLVDEMTEPRADWRALLRRFMTAVTRADYTWSQPNRRHLHRGMRLPSLRSEAMGAVVIAVDTSGSIGQEELRDFAGEINAIVEDVKPDCVHVLYVDSEVAGADVFERGEPVTINARGGGGTDFRPAFDWVEENAIEPVCLIYLTDMMGQFGDAPAYPVLWASTSEIQKAPFGDVIDISK